MLRLKSVDTGGKSEYPMKNIAGIVPGKIIISAGSFSHIHFVETENDESSFRG
jgi:hypothetical protein